MQLYCKVIDKHHILDVAFVIFHDLIGKTVCVSKYIGRDEDNWAKYALLLLSFPPLLTAIAHRLTPENTGKE